MELRAAPILCIVLSLSACNLLKKKGADAGAEETPATTEDSGAAATTAPTAKLATNEDDVARFPDETKLDNVSATAQRPYAVRDAPPAGTVVTNLAKGQAVTQIASRQKYFLVTFDDAKKGKLMGWVHADAFSAAPATLVEPKCAKGEIAVIGDTAFCGKPCATDADCSSGDVCKGSASKWNKGKPGDPVTICSGAKKEQDAGAAKPTADAAPPAPPTPPAPTTDIVDPTSGQCPPGYVVVKKDGKCHKLCPKASDCRAVFVCGECEDPAGKKNRVCNLGKNFCP